LTIRIENATCYLCKVFGSHCSYHFKRYGGLALCLSCSKAWNNFVEPKNKNYQKDFLQGRTFKQLSYEEYRKYIDGLEIRVEKLFDDFLNILIPEKVEFT